MRNPITHNLSRLWGGVPSIYLHESYSPVEVDLALSAHANARKWYEQKKKQKSKQEKTLTAHKKAFKAAEKKTRQQLSQEKSVAAISHIRKVHWFEKFNWFISSENYLVISGRDAQQNDMIVKRYMSKGDLSAIVNHGTQRLLLVHGGYTLTRRVRGEEEGINDSEDTEPFKELSDFGSENEAPDTELPVNVSDLPTDDKKITDLPSEVVSVPEITPSDINTTNSQELEDLLDKALELKSAATSAKKYGLKDLETELDKNNQEEKKGTVREKAYISKAERRKLKKGQTHSEGEDSGQWKKEVEKKNEVDNQSQKDVQSLNGSAKVSRGQKGKLKRMKKNMRIKMKKKGKSAWLYSRSVFP
ncbi:hypothetical protein L2E82_13936 [Cichorium intybus]|uniref:Uncharacterized protein n=1 Tax=Cichorium intybus TaxID=13427 RepID=A0ACB9EZD1_CICIN|nr:hypothetical protein L2E82_13936 [Cichorium intybus]